RVYGRVMATVTRVADAVAVGVELARVEDRRAVVRPVAYTVAVHVLIDAVGDAVAIAVGEALIDDAVAVVVEPIADLGLVLAGRLASRVVAVDQAVTVVVDAVGAGRIAQRSLVRRPAIGVRAVDQPVAVVVDAVEAGRVAERAL